MFESVESTGVTQSVYLSVNHFALILAGWLTLWLTIFFASVEKIWKNVFSLLLKKPIDLH